MNNKYLFKFLIITAFLLIGTVGIGQAQAQDVNVNVKVGDSFNFKVTKNDFTQSASLLNGLITSFNTSVLTTNSEYNMSSFNVSSMLQSFNISKLPAQGSVIGITVAQLPTTQLSNSSDKLTGALNVTYDSMTKTVTTGFLIGTPVVFTNWTFWKSALSSLQTTDPSANTQIDVGSSTSTTAFSANVNITFNQLPSEYTSTSASYSFSSLKVALAASYDTTTGVLNSESVALTLQGQASVTLTFAVARTTEGLSNSNTSSTPGFEAITLLGAIPLVAIYYKRKKEI